MEGRALLVVCLGSREGVVIGDKPETPKQIRDLPNKLDRKAKNEDGSSYEGRAYVSLR